MMEVEAQEFDSLLGSEARAPSRVGRIALAIGATSLLALGGTATWGGLQISESGIMEAAGESCSKDGEDCSSSLCCSDPASNCWRKNAHWASCNRSCESHMKWVDNAWEPQDNETVWDCHQLSAAKDGENCMYSRECANAESHCYKKNDHWASCNKTCKNEMLWENDTWIHAGEHVWDCHILSPAADGENCMESHTCKNEDSHCFLKNEHWASCNATCDAKNQWNQETKAWETTDDDVWNCKKLSCVEDGANCMDSRCCNNAGSTCFKKNEHWASCNATCTASYLWKDGGWKDQGEDATIWDCEELQPTDEDKTPPCDLSACDGCQGEQCTYCREEKQRDCCLETNCADSKDEQKCKDDNLETCCEKMTPRCKSSFTSSTKTE